MSELTKVVGAALHLQHCVTALEIRASRPRAAWSRVAFCTCGLLVRLGCLLQDLGNQDACTHIEQCAGWARTEQWRTPNAARAALAILARQLSEDHVVGGGAREVADAVIEMTTRIVDACCEGASAPFTGDDARRFVELLRVVVEQLSEQAAVTPPGG